MGGEADAKDKFCLPTILKLDKPTYAKSYSWSATPFISDFQCFAANFCPLVFTTAYTY